MSLGAKTVHDVVPVVHPIKTVIAVPPVTWLVAVQVMLGHATATDEQVTPFHLTSVGLLAAIPLNEKVVADGEAVFADTLPGKVNIIFPLAGIMLLVVNFMV